MKEIEKYVSSAAEKERLSKLRPVFRLCSRGRMKRPVGTFELRCPECGADMDMEGGGVNDRYVYYMCKKCDYEWASYTFELLDEIREIKKDKYGSSVIALNG